MISGLGAVFVNVLMTKMVTDWFAGREIVAAMAFFVSSWPLGIALGLIAFPPLATPVSGHRSVMFVTAAVVAISWCWLRWSIARRPMRRRSDTARLHIGLSRREWLLISLAGFVWGSFNAGYVILISFLPDLFAHRGYALSKQAV